MEERSSGTVEVAGSRLHYERMGAGADVVLVHGSVVDSRMWDEQFASFAARFRVLRYDMRCHGRSPCGDTEYAHRDDLAALLDALAIERAFIVALSGGSGAAIDFAVVYPGRVRALVIAPGNLSGYRWPDAFTSGVRVWQDAARAGDLRAATELLLDFAPMRTAAAVPELRARLEEMIREHTWGYLREGGPRPRPLSPPAAERLHEIAAPTLVVIGDLDMPAIKEQGEFVHRGIPGAEKVVIAGAGHMVNMERPAEFDRAVVDFLARVERIA